MRRSGIGILLCGLMAHAGAVAAGSGNWESDFETAKNRSSQTGLPLLIHFHADWCGPCRLMEREVLSTPQVVSVIGHTIVGVRVNSDHRKDLVHRFGITSLPTDVILSASGSVLSKSVGSPGRDRYVAKLKQFGRVSNVSPQPSAVAAAETDSKSAPTAVEDTVVAARKPVIPDENPSQPVQGEFRNPDVQDGEPGSADLAVSSGADSGAPVVAHKRSDSKPADDSEKLTPILKRVSDHRIGLNGFCPVTLTATSAWKAGKEEFLSDYQGVRYLMSSETSLKQFQSTPEAFIPMLHGFDPVALTNDMMIVSGQVELGATYLSRVYFFSSEKNRSQFLVTPSKYARPHNVTFFRTASPGKSFQ